MEVVTGLKAYYPITLRLSHASCYGFMATSSGECCMARSHIPGYHDDDVTSSGECCMARAHTPGYHGDDAGVVLS